MLFGVFNGFGVYESFVPVCHALALHVLPPCCHWGHECILVCFFHPFVACFHTPGSRLLGVLFVCSPPVMWKVKIDGVPSSKNMAWILPHVTLYKVMGGYRYNALYCPRSWEILIFSLHETNGKMDGWNTIVFLLGPGLFSGASC